MKRCSKCKIKKIDSKFSKRKLKSGRYGLRSSCNGCRKLEKREWKARTRFAPTHVIEKIKNGDIHGFGHSSIIIGVVEKLTSHLGNNVTWKQKLYHIKNDLTEVFVCKYCENKNSMFLDYKKEYSDFCSVRCKKAYNKEMRKEQSNNSSKRYNKKHPHIYAWRNVLRNCLVRMNQNKIDKTRNMLGYTAAELCKHLTRKFKSGMSWDNYGNWHVDHIKPVTKFNTDTPAHIVNALSNLQPLWGYNNISKGNK